MPATATRDFLEMLRRSGLVEAERLAQVVEQCKSNHVDKLPSAQAIADVLVETNLLTRWQCEKLFDRKYKGFFLGKYKLLGHLGKGGMSAVYLAEHVLMQRRVAIKVLPKRRVGDSSYLARFRLEAKAAAALDHPNVVRAYDVDNEGDTHYIVMEYVAGKNLQELVKHGEPLQIVQAVDYIAQAADGLEHAHQSGVIHRDVKPANLLVDENGVVKILDMGLALFDETNEASLTNAHSENVLGTADYLSPEQAINSHTVDARTDIYSLGCTLYFLLTGRAPFADGSIAQRIAKHQSETPTPIVHHRSDCPAELSAICDRMMAKAPQDRHESAHEVSEVLNAWLQSRGVRPRSSGSGSSSRIPLAKAGRSVEEKHDTVSNEAEETFPGIDDSAVDDVRGRWQRKRSSFAPSRYTRASYGETDGVSFSDTPVVDRDAMSFSEQRRDRRRRSKAPPTSIWVAIAVGVVVSIALSMPFSSKCERQGVDRPIGCFGTAVRPVRVLASRITQCYFVTYDNLLNSQSPAAYD